MNGFKDKGYRQFSDLNIEELNKYNFSVYVLDENWNYMFVNDFVSKNLGIEGSSLIGKNIWQVFPELEHDPSFITIRSNTDKGLNTNIVTTSPLTMQRLAITGMVLDDCTLFTSTILPKKEELLHELRSTLDRGR